MEIIAEASYTWKIQSNLQWSQNINFNWKISISYNRLKKYRAYFIKQHKIIMFKNFISEILKVTRNYKIPETRNLKWERWSISMCIVLYV